jgi:uncharacterized protein
MKKIGALTLALFFLIGIPLAASASSLGAGSKRVFDYAGLMSASEITSLEALIKDARAQYGMDIAVLTSNDAKDGASQAYADDFYDYNGFGKGPDGDGFLLFIDMHNRVTTVSTKGIMIRYITDARLSVLLDIGYAYLHNGEYGKAVTVTLMQLKFYLQQGIPSGQYNYTTEKTLTPGEMAVSLGAGLLTALVFISVVRHQYGLKGSTYKYDLQGNTTVSVTGAEDEYLRTSVVRTRRQMPSSGGGGGFGSSTHRSGSGSIHGGGSGRRF